MTLLEALHSLDAALRAGRATEAAQRIVELRSRAGAVERERAALLGEVARSRELLVRTLKVTMAEGLQPVAGEILDALLAIVGARRGFVGLVSGDGWTFLVARNLARDDIADPAGQVSTTIIDRVLATGEAVVTHDALQELDAASVHALALRSVACFPLLTEAGLLGFVYLDDARTQGRFDEAAVAAVGAWLPIVTGAVARAAERAPTGGLPGVLTRSPALLAVLDELARIAKFEVPVLLTGETGTGKSLVARQLHVHSRRAKGPFVHLNCGAIPEALLEGELFGAEAGAYTGAQGRRIGKFEAARGGTLFFDELDAMPLACQVKLLVALQERTITRLGGHAPIAIDVRVIAATNADPFTAIATGALREDLYYRVAVFVARLPALRERPEDVPFLARHVLARTAERYGLPPVRLSREAEEALRAHDWPGNVRELENVLDRAALLASGGTIERLGFEPRSRAPSRPANGVLAHLQAAAEALVDAMLRRPDLRDLVAGRALEGAVLVELARRLGSREAAFGFLGRAAEIRNRNHNRTWAREVGRLHELAAALGEPTARVSE